MTLTFRLGINYWPITSAMYWWQRFEAPEVMNDFALIRTSGFDCVRIFLRWEDFQPQPGLISKQAIARLTTVADIAAAEALDLIPTLFTGHMSGVNWIPSWALSSSTTPQRFRVVAANKVVKAEARNWYTDGGVLTAQTRLAGEVADALHAYKNIWAWDLGNENSNCVVPPNRDAGIEWLTRITSSIRSADPIHPITIGLHMEDLEEDRKLGPLEAGQFCDFLCMHGYPIYAGWSRGPKDALLLPFLGLITEWLGGRKVLFEEFGAPTFPAKPDEALGKTDVTLLTETDAAEFTASALSLLSRHGLLGGFIWCYGDYAPTLWELPPLDQALHERYFGLWRSDRSRKPATRAITEFAAVASNPIPRNFDWIDIRPGDFYDSPRENLQRLYQQFQLVSEQ